MALIVESKYTAPWVGGVPYAIKDKASDFKFDIEGVGKVYNFYQFNLMFVNN